MKAYPKKIVLTITKEDCRGEFYDNRDCGTSRSFKRRFPKLRGVYSFTYQLEAGRMRYKFGREFDKKDFYRIRRTGKSQKLTLTRV